MAIPKRKPNQPKLGTDNWWQDYPGLTDEQREQFRVLHIAFTKGKEKIILRLDLLEEDYLMDVQRILSTIKQGKGLPFAICPRCGSLREIKQKTNLKTGEVFERYITCKCDNLIYYLDSHIIDHYATMDGGN